MGARSPRKIEAGDKLRRLAVASSELERVVAEAVWDARRYGLSDGEVARLLEVARSTVQRRYGTRPPNAFMLKGPKPATLAPTLGSLVGMGGIFETSDVVPPSLDDLARPS